MTRNDVTTDEGTKAVEQIDANIERLRSVTDSEAFSALREETETLISSLSGKGSIAVKKEKRAAMAEVPEPGAEPSAGAELATADFMAIEGVSELITMGAERVAEGVRMHLKTSDLAKDVANIIMDVWRRIPNKNGLPDIMGTSQAARDAARAIYQEAGKGFEHDFDTEEALTKLQRAVQHQRSDVRARYLRSLNDDTPEAEAERKHFAKALEDKPADVSPAEYLASLYGTALKGHRELLAEQWRNKQDGIETPKELPNPTERVQHVTKQLRKVVTEAKPEDFQALSDEEKEQTRKELEELYAAVKAMITATL